MATSSAAPDNRRPARDPHGLPPHVAGEAAQENARHGEPPRRAEIGMFGRHRNTRQTVRISVAARPAEECSEQLAGQPQDKHPDGYDERRTEQHPAHDVDIARDIGGICGHDENENGGNDLHGETLPEHKWRHEARPGRPRPAL